MRNTSSRRPDSRWSSARSHFWLAASWLRLGWPLRLAWLLPVVLLVLVVERNVTGTNDSLPFAISPWPAVQVFGFEAIGTTLAALFAGTGLALLGVRAWRKSKRRFSGVLALLAGVATPALAWKALSALELLPFRVDQSRMIFAAALNSGPEALTAATAVLPLEAMAEARRALATQPPDIAGRAQLLAELLHSLTEGRSPP